MNKTLLGGRERLPVRDRGHQQIQLPRMSEAKSKLNAGTARQRKGHRAAHTKDNLS